MILLLHHVNCRFRKVSNRAFPVSTSGRSEVEMWRRTGQERRGGKAKGGGGGGVTTGKYYYNVTFTPTDPPLHPKNLTAFIRTVGRNRLRYRFSLL